MKEGAEGGGRAKAISVHAQLELQMRGAKSTHPSPPPAAYLSSAGGRCFCISFQGLTSTHPTGFDFIQ